MKSTKRITQKERLLFIEKLVCGFSTYAEVADELKVLTKQVRKWHREYEKQRLKKAHKRTQVSPSFMISQIHYVNGTSNSPSTTILADKSRAFIAFRNNEILTSSPFSISATRAFFTPNFSPN
ncbi:hypothetical protein PEPS_46840 (plasmid) [Persicobacter psychrovividus]|uniref:Helix-turn-helix domain-containing protein n=1 Tax=Persicobacter psychrovividus TaxID=387638 RepID=A0ABM7VN17_9BACT|nr:hypothetical protein PEPS_46840 [Persicobacter psychrovividus]